MHVLDADENGVYTIPAISLLIQATVRRLDGAVPPCRNPLAGSARGESSDAGNREDGLLDEVQEERSGHRGARAQFGWLSGALPCPGTGSCYVVEFVARDKVHILGYIDRDGCAYTCDRVLTEEPQSAPDLNLMRVADGDASECEPNDVEGEAAFDCGYVEARMPDSAMRRVARYRHEDGAYTLAESWFDFEPYREGLSYNDLMARCYLAFIYRPTIGGSQVPYCGLEGIEHHLTTKPLLSALNAIVQDVRRASFDPHIKPPALVRALARWLIDIDLKSLPDVADQALQLVRTSRSIGLFRVEYTNSQIYIPELAIQTIEAVLNRYLLVNDALGEAAATSNMRKVALYATKALQAVAANLPELEANPVASQKTVDAYSGDLEEGLPLFDAALGEWDYRCDFSRALQNLRTPFRVEVEFHCELESGMVAMLAEVPEYRVMPLSSWNVEKSNWVVDESIVRRHTALRYALQFGVACAAEAFAASPEITCIEFLAGIQPGNSIDLMPANSSEFIREPEFEYVCQATFEREAFCADGAYYQALNDPEAFWAKAGGWYKVIEKPAYVIEDPVERRFHAPDDVRELFDVLDDEEDGDQSGDIPETVDGLLPESVRSALGGRYVSDMRITANSVHRHAAEQLAGLIPAEASDAEAIRLVRSFQGQATDPFGIEACNRVMAELAKGTLDRSDQNELVNCYLGEDEHLTVLARAHECVQSEVEKAQQIIVDHLEAVENRGDYSDTAEVVYRSFDTYASRLLYNRARMKTLYPADQVLEGFDFGAGDAGKRVQLIPDTLYLCYLEAVRLLEHSFTHSDIAIALGKRCIEIAPTVIGGYRQLARSYMLVGDMESARDALEAALHVAVGPHDVAVSYYQLGYVMWKSEDPQAGVACYLKSASISPLVTVQAMAELRELMKSEGAHLIEKRAIDDELKRAGITVAPTSRMLDVVLEGAAGATDAGMFKCADSLLAVYLHYKPDDVLAEVARSFAYAYA